MLEADSSESVLVAVVEAVPIVKRRAVEVLVEEACEGSVAALKDAKLVSVNEVVAVLVLF